MKEPSVLCLAGSAGGGHGVVVALDSGVEQVPEGSEVIKGHRNPSTHYFFGVNDPAVKKIGGLGAFMRESQRGEVPVRMDVESSVAKRLLNRIRINYRRIRFS